MICAADGCRRPAHARQLCGVHYNRRWKRGEFGRVRTLAECAPVVDGDIARVPLTQGRVAIIDATDVDLVRGFRWTARCSPGASDFYAVRGHRETVLMHRVIIDAPSGFDVDHANHDTLDNRRSNLRVASRRDNNRNRRAPRVDGVSGYLGVGYHAQTGRWRARVAVDGRRLSLGLFVTAQEAALARDRYIREHCPSEFWTFNFPLLPGERGISNHAEEATA